MQGKDQPLGLRDVPVGLTYPIRARFLAFPAGGTVKLGMQYYCVHVCSSRGPQNLTMREPHGYLMSCMFLGSLFPQLRQCCYHALAQALA